MHRAINQLKIVPEFIIVDGNKFKDYQEIPHQTIVKGDSKYLSIAAASVLAKTYRDEFMEKIHQEFPMYNWQQNKGYPTKAHRNAIREFGITKYSSIRIAVLDKDPQMAADIANEIASLIDTVMNNLQKGMAEQGYKSLLKDSEFVLSEIKILEDSIAKIRAFGVNDYESQSEVLNEQWAVAKIANNQSASKAIEKKLAILSKYGGQYSALRDNLVHSRGRLNYVQKKLNEHKLTAEEQLEHKFIVNAAVPALKKSYPIRWLIVLTTSCVSALMMIVLIVLKEQIKQISQS